MISGDRHDEDESCCSCRWSLGALSGFGAGLVVVFAAAIASNLAPNTTLAGVLMVVVGTFGGGVGTYLTRRGQKAA